MKYLIFVTLISFAYGAQAQLLKPIEHETCQAKASGIALTVASSQPSVKAFRWESNENLVTLFRSKGFEVTGSSENYEFKDGDLYIHIGVACTFLPLSPVDCTIVMKVVRKDSKSKNGEVTLAQNIRRYSDLSAAQIRDVFNEGIEKLADRIPICETNQKN